MLQKKALFLHGYLGGAEDMTPFFLEGYECHSVSLRNYMKNKVNIFDDFPGPYDLALGYSYGGRVLASLLEKKPDYVFKPVFASSRISAYTDKQLKERNALQKKLILMSLNDFEYYWNTLPLFQGHSMSDYRVKYKIDHEKWNQEEISYYLKNEFTYENPVDYKKFYTKSSYFYGNSDVKYKSEAKKLPFTSKSFKGGHRFLFEQVEAIKKELVNLK